MDNNRLSSLLWNIRHRISLWPKQFGMMEGFLFTIFFGYGVASIIVPRHLNKPLPLLIPVALFGLAIFFACSPIIFPQKSEKR